MMRWQKGFLSVLAGVLCFGSVVLAGPQVLEVSPRYLEFTGYEGGANPAAQVVSIWNSGHGPMDWTVTTDSNWITVEPNSGTSSGEVDDANIIVDINGLVEGIYNCQLTVTGSGAPNSPQIVDVSLEIIYEPNLVGRWRFDESSGTTAYDSVGGNHGTLVNGPIWTSGQINGALEFDDVDDYVSFGTGPAITGTGPFSVSAWVKTDSLTAGTVVVQRSTGSADGSYGVTILADGRVQFHTYNGGYGLLFQSDVTVDDGLWHHVAAVRTNSTDGEIYVDGSLSGSDSGPARSLNSVPVWVGGRAGGSGSFDGVIDDVRVYSRALSGGEVLQLYGEGLGGIAFGPSPIDGATGVNVDVVLSWSPGTWAADVNGHDVYFGTDYTDVNAATTASAEYMGNYDTNSWSTANYDPCGLGYGTWYYWRIEEVNEFDANSPWKGNVWSFETGTPAIGLSGTQFDFMAPEGGANPDDQILSIGNTGIGTLNWEITEECSWLTVEPNNGSSTGEADDVNLSVDITGLTGGTYNCQLTVSDPNASNSPQIVDVNLVIYGLVSWWEFDEGSGTTAYDSASGNDGTIYGAVWTSGQIGGALEFDGSADYVSVLDSGTSSLDITDAITISAWINVDEWNDNTPPNFNSDVVVRKDGAYILYRYWDNLDFYLYGPDHRLSYPKSNISLDEWYHVAATYDGAFARMYISGAPVVTEAATGSISTSDNNLVIGARSDGGGMYFDGIIDDVRVYSRALTGSEILQLSREGFGGRAFDPSPYDGATGADVNVVLKWSAGTWVGDFNGHDVYFGTDYNDVNEATTSSAEYMGNYDTNSWDPCGLEYGRSHYWRVDEVNGSEVNSPWKGDVWSFKTRVSRFYIYVDAAGSGDCEDIQAGINMAGATATVMVAPGTYTGSGNRDLDFGGKAITVRSTDPEDPCVVAATVIDCEDSGRGFYFHSGEDGNSILSGLTITNGYVYDAPGSGIYCSGASPRIEKCIISNNTTRGRAGIDYAHQTGGEGLGGGICCVSGSSPIIMNCAIMNNLAEGGRGSDGFSSTYGGDGGNGCGGGLYSDSNSYPTITNCVIGGNTASGGRGGFSMYEGGGDGGDGYGGGVHSSLATLQNCTVANNIVTGGAGGGGSSPGTTGSAICGGVYGTSTVSSSIIWGNDDNQIEGSATVTYSDIEGSWGGEGNIDADPCFADAAADDYRLFPESPCIDAGDPNYAGEPNETDMDGDPRIINGRIDMGADEYSGQLPFLEVSPLELRFTAEEGGPNPGAEILYIQNTGGGTITWSIWEDCNWLSVEPNNGNSGGEVNEVVVTVDVSGLSLGMYNCELTVTGEGAMNSPEVVDVNLIVGPLIELSATQLEFTAYEGGANPNDQTLGISNIGGGTLNWTVSEDCNWLSVEPNSGSSIGEVNDVNVSVDISGLVAGVYDCNLVISDANAVNNPQSVSVRLYLYPYVEGALYVPVEYATIQAAVDTAVDGNIIIVAPISYTGSGNKNLDFGGMAITVRGFAPSDPCVVAATVIDCENSGRGFYLHSGEGSDSVVSGLTIKRGKVSNRGGGIYCAGSPTIEHCIIINNNATEGGGGISCHSESNPIIINCTISNNTSKGANGSGPGVDGGDGYGGGIYCSSYSNVIIENCIISGNGAYGGDGYMGTFPTDGGDAYGGGIYCVGLYQVVIITNCTIINNTVAGGDGLWPGDDAGAGVYGSGKTTITDSILWGNGDDVSACSATYSCIEEGYGGEGNISADPCFVTGPLGDYYLSQIAAGEALNSPCMDAGSDTASNLGLEIYTTRTDEVGDAGMVDMGYHYSIPNPADIDEDGDVDFVDFDILASQWLDVPGSASADVAPPGGDGVVDGLDLGLLVDYWLWQE